MAVLKQRIDILSRYIFWMSRNYNNVIRSLGEKKEGTSSGYLKENYRYELPCRVENLSS